MEHHSRPLLPPLALTLALARGSKSPGSSFRCNHLGRAKHRHIASLSPKGTLRVKILGLAGELWTHYATVAHLITPHPSCRPRFQSRMDGGGGLTSKANGQRQPRLARCSVPDSWDRFSTNATPLASAVFPLTTCQGFSKVSLQIRLQQFVQFINETHQ